MKTPKQGARKEQVLCKNRKRLVGCSEVPIFGLIKWIANMFKNHPTPRYTQSSGSIYINMIYINIWQYSSFREVGAASSYVRLFCILLGNSCNLFPWDITCCQKYQVMHWCTGNEYVPKLMFTIYAKKIKFVLIEPCLPHLRWWLLLAVEKYVWAALFENVSIRTRRYFEIGPMSVPTCVSLLTNGPSTRLLSC